MPDQSHRSGRTGEKGRDGGLDDGKLKLLTQVGEGRAKPDTLLAPGVRCVGPAASH